MARTRLVDPMATVEAVSRDALGVATQAETDAAAGTLERYRDTDEARREAPVVTGSTSDGTALQSVIAALRGRGMVVDASETVDDVITAENLTVIGDTFLTGDVTIRQNSTTALRISDGVVQTLSIDAINRVVDIREGGKLQLWGGFGVTDRGSWDAATGNLNVTGAATLNGDVTLGNATTDGLTINPATVAFTNDTNHVIGINAVTGSNTAGKQLTIQAGPGTGNATGSAIVFSTPTATTSGSTTQTLNTRLTLNASGTTVADDLTVNGAVKQNTYNFSAPVPTIHLSNFYYGGLTTLGSRSVTTHTTTANYVYFVPVVFPKDGTVTALAVEVTTLSTNNLRIGLYDSDQTNNYPYTRLVQTGLLSVTGTGVKEETGLSVAVSGGKLYWIAVGATATPEVRAMVPSGDLGGMSAATVTVGVGALIQTGTTVSTALPATTSINNNLSGKFPHVLAKLA